MQVSVQEAQLQLSRLLELVEEGETVIIARHGRPVAELVPARTTGLQLGIACGEPLVPPGDEWWQPMSDEEADSWVVQETTGQMRESRWNNTKSRVW
jgi:prevent-host-death family protein